MNVLIKRFTLTYAELCIFTAELVANMTRDTVEFALRGVNAAAITALQALGNAFEVFPPDEVYVGEIKDLTSEKNILRETVTLNIQTISGFFEQKWGISSGKYTSLRVTGLQRMTDANFLLTARNVVSQATIYLTVLTPIGLTQAMIDSLEDNAQLLEDKIIAITTKKELRDTKAEERIEKANELYNYVTEYCKIGKLIWEHTSEAKYNDYIIYKTVEHNLSKPQNLVAVYNPTPSMTIDLTWDAVTDATSYDVYYNIANIGAPSGEYQLLNNFLTNSAVIPAILIKRNYFKVKARNETNTSDYSDEAFADVTE